MPAGSAMTRFSTLPSSLTSTAIACVGDRPMKPIERNGTSRLGTITRPAQADRPDNAAVVAASASSTGP